MNIITIEKNVPIPTPLRGLNASKYKFMRKMDIGDSFVINGNTPDYDAAKVRSYIYSSKTNQRYGMKFSVRTLEGPSKEPTAIRVWRVK